MSVDVTVIKRRQIQKKVVDKYKPRLRWSTIHRKWSSELLDVHTRVNEQVRRCKHKLRADIHAQATHGVISTALWKLIDEEMFSK